MLLLITLALKRVSRKVEASVMRTRLNSGCAVTISNFPLKWDNAPANYGAFFDGSEVRLRFYFAVGRYPLAV